MRIWWIVLPLLLCGCFFHDAAEPRYFRPASRMLDGAGGDAVPARGAIAIRLQPIAGTPFLRERMVWRSSDVEYGLYEQRRWSELPASYVQRALENALRATPGLRLTDDVDAPVLRVDVVAFEERLAPQHVAGVALAVSLRDRERRRLVDRVFSAETPIDGAPAAATASAIGGALDEAVAAVASSVASAVGAQ
jgi:ABC-type uncharacterized transport system auxiliary subunit